MTFTFSSILRSKTVYYLSIFILIFCSGCAETEERIGGEMYYYDLAGLLQTEIGHLNTTMPTIVKQTSLAGEKESLETSAVDWSKELELFMKADINKPAYKNSYITDRPDSSTVVYTLKPSENLTVQQLTIRYDSVSQQPVHIDGTFESVNKLYESKRSFSLTLEQGHLKAYHVHGYQKLVMMDKRPFDILVTIK